MGGHAPGGGGGHRSGDNDVHIDCDHVHAEGRHSAPVFLHVAVGVDGPRVGVHDDVPGGDVW